MKKIKSGLYFLIVLLVAVIAVYCIWQLIFRIEKPAASQHNVAAISSVEKSSSSVKKKKTKNIKLVALGDSLTQGVGDPTNRGGYVDLIQKKLDDLPNVKVKTYNYGKTGDRSDQILQRLQQTTAIQQQLKQANVIVITVGGNDLMQVLEKSFSNLSNQKLAAAVTSSKTAYQNKLATLMQQVRKYNPTAPIFVYSVYNPFYVYFPTISQFNKYTDAWNTATKQIVLQNKRTYFVNIEQRMSAGQYLHKTSVLKKDSVTDITVLNKKDLNQALMNQKEKNDYLSSADHFHPNLRGYRYMTNKLYTVMMEHKTTWLAKKGG